MVPQEAVPPDLPPLPEGPAPSERPPLGRGAPELACLPPPPQGRRDGREK